MKRNWLLGAFGCVLVVLGFIQIFNHPTAIAYRLGYNFWSDWQYEKLAQSDVQVALSGMRLVGCWKCSAVICGKDAVVALGEIVKKPNAQGDIELNRPSSSISTLLENIILADPQLGTSQELLRVDLRLRREWIGNKIVTFIRTRSDAAMRGGASVGIVAAAYVSSGDLRDAGALLDKYARKEFVP
ncbi:MAG: hypothetical protein HOO99_18830 [Hyphomicrobiaceae bacterium]|nr:hypothetical protein [Hyphomicrobiaceae bacterium]